MSAVCQTTARCCIFNKIHCIFIEKGLIIRGANEGTEPGAQRSQWVHLSRFLHCVLSQPCVRIAADPGNAEVKD